MLIGPADSPLERVERRYPGVAVCLLVLLFGVDPDAPLVVAANRDERLDRPAVAMTVLAEGGPRILGGRDNKAGGTWLAVNEYGVVAGLTNRPAPDGADPARRCAVSSPSPLPRTETRRTQWQI